MPNWIFRTAKSLRRYASLSPSNYPVFADWKSVDVVNALAAASARWPAVCLVSFSQQFRDGLFDGHSTESLSLVAVMEVGMALMAGIF
jgi:hypothetical protein